MENKENLVIDMAENVEKTTEETTKEKTYTQSDVDSIVSKAKARARAQAEREARKKYGETETLLMTGTGAKTLEEANGILREHWNQSGVEVKQQPRGLSEREIEILAQSDADDVIRTDGVEDEIRYLEGLKERSARENATLRKLKAHHETQSRNAELARIGVTAEEYGSKEFRDFAAKFTRDTPVTEIYSLYQSTKPKQEIKTPGSMKNTASGDSEVKDYYSFEEANKFTKKDFDNNPALYRAVLNSMTKW